MSAREALMDAFGKGFNRDQVAMLVDLALEAHAHELAEEIRADKCGTGELCGCGEHAASLIDPEVE